MGGRDESVLISGQKGHVRYLTINRPDVLNALNGRVFHRLEEELELAASDPGTRALVLTGSGDRAFSAGADLDEFNGLDTVDTRRLLDRGQRVLRSLERLGKPVVAAINGYALGGGFELALACSLMIGSESARFGLPEVTLGLMPGYGGTQRLPQIVGKQTALRLMLSGERIDARRAWELGLLCQAPISDDELLETASKLAVEISRHSPKAASLILESYNASNDLDAGLAHETSLAALAASSEDAAEGIRAFREKRTPAFRVGDGDV